MRASFRIMQLWLAPLLRLPEQDEQAVAIALVRLDRAFSSSPPLLRRLADRSCPEMIRLEWLTQALHLSSDGPLARTFRAMLQGNGFVVWSAFFHEYLRLRERVGRGKVFLLFSHTPLHVDELATLQIKLEHQFAQPALIHSVTDLGLRGGFRVESHDGWVLDASVQGHLNRLALALAT